MSKFRITKPNGEQEIIETDMSIGFLEAKFGPSTDIQPIVEEVAAPVAGEEAPKPKRKAKVAEE